MGIIRVVRTCPPESKVWHANVPLDFAFDVLKDGYYRNNYDFAETEHNLAIFKKVAVIIRDTGYDSELLTPERCIKRFSLSKRNTRIIDLSNKEAAKIFLTME